MGFIIFIALLLALAIVIRAYEIVRDAASAIREARHSDCTCGERARGERARQIAGDSENTRAVKQGDFLALPAPHTIDGNWTIVSDEIQTRW